MKLIKLISKKPIWIIINFIFVEIFVSMFYLGIDFAGMKIANMMNILDGGKYSIVMNLPLIVNYIVGALPATILIMIGRTIAIVKPFSKAGWFLTNHQDILEVTIIALSVFVLIGIGESTPYLPAHVIKLYRIEQIVTIVYGYTPLAVKPIIKHFLNKKYSKPLL